MSSFGGKLGKAIDAFMGASNAKDPNEIRAERERASQQALFEMKISTRRLARDLEKREQTLEERRAKIKDLKRRGREDRAAQEAELYVHDRAITTKLRTVLIGQEKALITAQGLKSTEQFVEATQMFVKMGQLNETPGANIEYEMLVMSQKLDSMAAVADVDAGLEPETRRRSAAVDDLLDEIDDEIWEDEQGGGGQARMSSLDEDRDGEDHLDDIRDLIKSARADRARLQGRQRER